MLSERRHDAEPKMDQSDALVAVALELLVHGEHETYVFPDGSDAILAQALEQFLDSCGGLDEIAQVALERLVRLATILEVEEGSPSSARLIANVLAESATALQRLEPLEHRLSSSRRDVAALRRLTGSAPRMSAAIFGIALPEEARPLSSFINPGDQRRRGSSREGPLPPEVRPTETWRSEVQQSKVRQSEVRQSEVRQSKRRTKSRLEARSAESDDWGA
ncbi:MAG: hypothetical protein IPK13_28045 [Deltaproteobacteria bacterium]|nr:hypothetical protein [Deltaproteobacteria bacterium]